METKEKWREININRKEKKRKKNTCKYKIISNSVDYDTG